MVKNPTADGGNAIDARSIARSGRSFWRRAWQPTPVFLPREHHGQRSLAGYSPQGCKVGMTGLRRLTINTDRQPEGILPLSRGGGLQV